MRVIAVRELDLRELSPFIDFKGGRKEKLHVI